MKRPSCLFAIRGAQRALRSLLSLTVFLAACSIGSIASAHNEPGNCNATGPAIVVEVLQPDGSPLIGSIVSECESIAYRVTLKKAESSGGVVCAFSQGTFTLKTPDGVDHVISGDVPCLGGTEPLASECPAGQDELVSALIPYTVSPADVAGGIITATATYAGGVAHDAGTDTPGVSAITPKSNAVNMCGDDLICTDDICDPDMHGPLACSNPPVVCPDDGNACTIERCDATDGCVADPLDCPDDGNACTVERCDTTDGCVDDPLDCPDDGNACTVERCDTTDGCVDDPLDCPDDGNACTVERCDTTDGCVDDPLDCPDDGNACTVERCDTTDGCVDDPLDCPDDGNACTVERCDTTDGCVDDPLDCPDDGDACTVERCDTTDGCVDDPLDCPDDGDACTVERCDTTDGCVDDPLDCPDDGNACTIESCDATDGCVDDPLNCVDDGNACTVERCDETDGCVADPLNCPDDGNACTVERCDTTDGCVADALECPDDGDACTIERCDTTDGCVADALECPDDGNPCTIERCDATDGCVTDPVVCPDDGDICTDDFCDETSGACVHPEDPTNDPSCRVDLICRTPGFWATHAKDTRRATNITQAVIDMAGGCLEVCGEEISNTITKSADSALEAMCVRPRGDQRLQLGRQLTAMALNCVISDAGLGCADVESLSMLFDSCNDACRGADSVLSVNECIGIVDCFNNGGVYNGMTGECGPDPVQNCHEQALPEPFNPPGPAASGRTCRDAKNNDCAIIPPYEQSGGSSGCSEPGNETDPDAEFCGP